MVALDVLEVLHDVVIETKARGINEITDKIILDPLVGPFLGIPGRRLTASDFRRGIERVQSSSLQHPLEFYDKYIADFGQDILGMLSRVPELHEICSRLQTILHEDRDDESD